MTSSNLTLIPIPALKDNYIWCLVSSQKKALVVDPGDANPVYAYLNQHDLILEAILVTHHHWDHTAGLADLKKYYPKVNVFGPASENISGLTHLIKEGDTLNFPTLDNLSFEVLNIPGHTRGHVAYFNNTWLFCGDTLFSCGCGRLFEGTPAQMYQSLQKISNLDNSILVCCGHEYTLANLNFALTVEPGHPGLLAFQAEVKKLKAGCPSLPIRLAQEKELNAFLRCHESVIIQAVQHYTNDASLIDPIEVFTQLRKWKDVFS